MNVYRHRFPRVEDYLHHRPPCLLVNEIVAIDRKQIVTVSRITGEEFFVAGHFPGAPVVPGAMMQEMMTQSAGILIAAEYNPMPEFNTHDPSFNEFALGVLVRVTGTRFRGFARPGDTLQITVVLNEVVGELFDFTGRITRAGTTMGTTIGRAEFQLTNIRSSVLTGRTPMADRPVGSQ